MRNLLTVVPLLIATFLISAPSPAQIYSDTDTVSVVSSSGHPGDTIMVPFDLVNTFAVGAYLFRVTFDSLLFVPLSMSLAPRSQGFDLNGANFNEPGVATFFATSMRPMDNPILPGRGPIVNISFSIRGYAAPGSYLVRFQDADSTIPQNSLSNIMGDSLVIPIFVDAPIEVLEPQSVDDAQSVPDEFALAQNYPNPFNSSTRISFTLERPENINLTILDLLGRRVIDLYSGLATPGETGILWDGRNSRGENVVSGVYFCRLLEDQRGQVITIRMTLLK